MHFFFANALRCRHFPNFPPDIFLKTQRHLFAVIIFKTEGSKEYSFWKIFILLYLQITCYRDVQLPCVSIYQYRSSYIIKHWPVGNFTVNNESVREYYRSTPRESSIKRITRIVSQNLQKAKKLTATTSTSKTVMSQTIIKLLILTPP